MLKLLRTAATWKGRDHPDPAKGFLGVFWGSGVLELFVVQGDTMKVWRSPAVVPDVTRLREGVLKGLQDLGCRPDRAVILLLHPELQQLSLEVPAAAAAPVIETLVQRSLDQQITLSGQTVWRDVPLIPEGDRARRMVYAMPEILHRAIRESLRELGIDLCAMIPFSGLAFLEDLTAQDREAVGLDAWRLPCGIAVGLRRGPDFWMVRPLTLDPDDAPRVSRELRQTLVFARQRWDVSSSRIRLRGPTTWVGAIAESLRFDGVGNEVIGGIEDEDWRSVILRRARGSCVDLVPFARDVARRRLGDGSSISHSLFGAISSGLLLSILMVSEGYRIRVGKMGVEREARAAEGTLEDLEAWSVHRNQIATLARPWTSTVDGIPANELPALVGELLPDELVLTELDFRRSESVWQLALSGHTEFSEKAKNLLTPEGAVAQFETNLVSGIGVRPSPAIPKRSALESVRPPWSEILANEPSLVASGDRTVFRKEWILP